MIKIKKNIKDHPLIIIIVLLCILSCFAILNAAPLITKVSSPYSLWKKQLLYYVLSFIILFIIYYIGNDAIYQYIHIIYYLLLFLLFLLAFDHIVAYKLLGWAGSKHLIPLAHSVGGATSWFKLPGFNFQPSEFIKIAIIVYLAKITKEHNEKMLIRSMQSELEYLFHVLKIIIPPIVLIYLQNDAGVVLIILSGIFFLVYSSALRKEWFLLGGAVIVGVLGVFIYLYIFQHEIFTSIITGHKLSRIYGWLDPEGTVGDEGYQLFYSLLSYGSAGWFGHGFQSTVKVFPEAQTDFIFAVIVTDYGYIGGILTIALIVALDVVLLRIGLKSENMMDKHFTIGIFGLLFFQQVWNIAMILGLLPITGITLPFISYGGSSLWSYMISIGMFLNIEYTNNLMASTKH